MIRKVWGVLAREWVVGLAAVLAGGLVIGGWAVANYAAETRAAISGSVIRLHVRANSDSEADQALKMIVRDAALAEANRYVGGAGTIDMARVALVNHMRDIEGAAAAAVAGQGKDYAVVAYLTRDTFPTKDYGGARLPAGEYEALRVDIGAAAGRNWWCVLYPPLCVTAAVAEMPEASVEKLKGVLTAEQYRLVTRPNDRGVKVRLKILEMARGGRKVD